MTILLEIPKEFEEHITYDKFQDSLNRVYYDLKDKVGHGNLSGNYELELIDMLRKVFNKAEVAKPLVPSLNTLSDFSSYHFVPEEVEMDHVFYSKGEI